MRIGGNVAWPLVSAMRILLASSGGAYILQCIIDVLSGCSSCQNPSEHADPVHPSMSDAPLASQTKTQYKEPRARQNDHTTLL